MDEKERRQKEKHERKRKKRCPPIAKNPQTPTVLSTDNTYLVCPACNMSCEDPPTEDWIQCHQCKEWWHDSCSEPAPVTKDMDSSHAICVEVEIDNQQTDLGIGCYVVNLPQH